MKTRHRARRRAAGFTLIETLIVLLIFGILIMLVLPSFLQSIQHQKLLSVVRQTATLMRLARLQAIKTAISTVVQVDTAKGTVTAFSDANNNHTLDSGETIVGQFVIDQAKAKSVSFMAVLGFTNPPNPAVAVFLSNGSVLCPAATTPCTIAGAFRFQDVRGDQLEACVVSAAQGKIVLMKSDATAGDRGCGAGWRPNEGGNPWKWN